MNDLVFYCSMKLLEFQFRQLGKRPFYNRLITKGFKDFLRNRKEFKLLKEIEKREKH